MAQVRSSIYPSRRDRVRISGPSLVIALLLGSATLTAQEVPRLDTVPVATSGPGLQLPPPRDSLVLPLPPELQPLGRLGNPATAPDRLTAALGRDLARQRTALWRDVVTRRARAAAALVRAPERPGATDFFGQYADLGLQLQSRVETRFERDRNERCQATDLLSPIDNCQGAFQPQFNFQFAMKTGGVVANRLHLNVDYDTQREFDASNNISVYYEGKPNDIIKRVEAGNVSFTPPPSRFITAGIPSGNYGIQAVGQLGPMNFQAIAAQQRGNIVRDRVFTVGDRTVQSVDRVIEDYQLERRRFFWVIDPRVAFPDKYPNIDILDPSLPSLLARIPPGERPRRVLLYRYRSPAAAGSAAPVINGPFAVLRFANNTNVIGPFEVLQQGVDYYIDPTNLWVVLVNPLSADEKLAVSYTVTGPDGREAVVGSVGGTFPKQKGIAGRDTLNLLWDNRVLPGDPAFDREIRSVYRVGGDELQRQTFQARIVVGSGNDQEKPIGGTVDTYLQLFGLAQRNNSSTFDVTNRLWPRATDPNQALTISGGLAGTSSKLIRDYFIVFPSLMPFADSGLAHPPNPVNDSLYRVTDEDLNSPRRPPTQYRIHVSYSAAGSGEAGSLMLGSVQVRPFSERIFLDGRQLVRDSDYTVDYEVGRVTFNRPDTLFATPRQVSVQFEENPVFTTAPTSIFGLAAEFPSEYGSVDFTALQQSQQTSFNRPPLGFEPQSSLLAGVRGDFTWESAALSHLLDKLPLVDASAPSTVNFQGEFATSRPQANAAGAAYIETFEGAGGVPVDLRETAWRYGSQPAIINGGVPIDGTLYDFPLDSASTMAWQNLGTVLDPLTGVGSAVQFFPEQIDSSFVFIGGQTFRSPETVLWLDLYPGSVGGLPDAQGQNRWFPHSGGGRPWRSISQSLSPNGVDLSHVETLEFWTLVDTAAAARASNPALIFDFGDISENTVAFAPETLTVRGTGDQGLVDSLFTGRKLQGFDKLNTERDPVTQSFDVARNDIGLPGDIVDTLFVNNLAGGLRDTVFNRQLCRRGDQPVLPLGDATADCTVGNRRLDEDDLDRDGVLNFTSAQRNNEQILRYVVDLSNRSTYSKIGRCYRSMTDTSSVGVGVRTVCWTKVRVAFASPTEQINNPLIRRIVSMRLTVVAGRGHQPNAFTQFALARLRLTGAPWTKRTDRAIAGIGGENANAPGTVIATTIGTQDRDDQGGLTYQSPPGVTDEPDSKGGVYSPGVVQVNEQSLRVQALNVPLYHRAEAYFRFPDGEKNFMGYRELRVWARGRNKGWGPQGDLQFYIKLGRDDDNFYLYRTPVNQGGTSDAWLPEVSVDFRRFFALRAQIENAFLRGGSALACHGLDSALVANSLLPTAPGTQRFAACDSGYIVYTSNPAINPPNLAAVQELAVGILRVNDAGQGSGGSITPGDTLELWVDDIRLTSVVNDPGYAGQVGLNIAAADLGTFSINASRKDDNFRQLGEQPSFVTDNDVNLSSSIRLDKLLPRSLGLLVPVTVTHDRSGGDPHFLSGSDLLADAVPDVRTPSSSTTSYSIAVRRASPLEHSTWAPLVNNLVLTSTYVTSNARTELQTAHTSAFTAGLDFNLVSRARTVRTPGWMQRVIDHLPDFLRNSELLQSLRDASLRWNPTQVRFTSTYADNANQRQSFLFPVPVAQDLGQSVRGLDNVWRNTGTVELRPFNSLSARWDISSLRDLRDYGDSTGVGVVAGAERQKLLGLNMGIEREREMSTVISASPPLASWIRPRVDFTSSFAVYRDPNAPDLITQDSLGPYRLPRRMSNSQGLAVGATVDFARLASVYSNDSSNVRALARALSPVDVQWRRDLRSTFDGVAFDPSVGYQLALGGVEAFRTAQGAPATSAGVSRNLIVSHSLYLPYGLTVVDRYSDTHSTSWSQLVNIQTILDAEQQTFPDVSVRWTYVPRSFLRAVFTSLTAQAGARITRANSFQPTTANPGALADTGLSTSQTLWQYPMTGSLVWSILGGFFTDATWNRIDQKEVRSGGLTQGSQHDLSLHIGKALPLPSSWNLKSNMLRTRLGYQNTHTQSFFVQDTARTRVTDNGRWAVTLNADSDVSDTMSLTLLLARVLTFDNVFDRRFSQTVLSVAFHLSFAAGELR